MNQNIGKVTVGSVSASVFAGEQSVIITIAESQVGSGRAVIALNFREAIHLARLINTGAQALVMEGAS